MDGYPSKALTLKQPWAWAVLHGKNIENRTWSTRLRGWFWIHTSQTMTPDYYQEVFEYCQERRLELPAAEDIKCGGIVGRAKISKVYPKVPSPTERWHMPNQYGFVLECVEEVPFVPCKGARNFWNVSDEVIGELVRLRVPPIREDSGVFPIEDLCQSQ